MNIFNQPPTISEDTLVYRLYPPAGISSKAAITALAVNMKSYVESVLPEMQWHRDSFELKVSGNPNADGYIIQGHMRVGDCVDDEWCAVWVLREISSKWDVAIRCVSLLVTTVSSPDNHTESTTQTANFC